MKKNLFYIVLFLVCISTQAQNSLYITSEQFLFDEGYEFYQQEKYNAAIVKFEEYLAKFPKDNVEAAQFYIASSHLFLFHSVGEQSLLEFLEQHPEHFLVNQANLELGNYFYFESNYESAIPYYKEVEIESLEAKQRSEYNFKMAYSYFAKKDFKTAGDLFDKARLRDNKYQSASAYYAGYIYIEEKQWERAYNILLTLKDDKSYGSVVPSMIAKALYNLENWDELISYTTSVLDSNSNVKDKQDLQLYLGSGYFGIKDYENTIKFLTAYNVVATQPNRDVSFRLGYSYYKQTKYPLAVANLKNAMIPDDSLSQVGAYYLGVSYLELKEKKYAITAFKQASDLSYDKNIVEEALYNYGKINYEIGDNSNTIISFSRLLKEYPNTKYENELKEVLSDAYLKSNNYEDALTYLEQIRDKNDYIKKAYQNAAFMLAVKHYNCSDFLQTELYIDKAFLYPIDDEIKASSYFLKGEMLSQKGEANLAILAYSGVFQTDKERTSNYYLQARYGIAYQYYNHKEFLRARSHFQYYVENPPKKDKFYYDAKVRLADCFYIDKLYQEAAKQYEEVASESEYLNDYTLFQSGVLNYLLNKPEESKAFFKLLAKKYPTSGYSDNALYQTAIVDFERSNYQESILSFTSLIEKYPTSVLVPYALEKRGFANLNIKNYKKANLDFENIIDNYPRHEVAKSAIFSLQESLNNSGESSKFSTYLEKYKMANPEDSNIENVEFENAKNLYLAEKYDNAIVAFEKFISSYSISSLVYDAKYYLAESYFGTNKMDKSLKLHEEVMLENKSFYTSKSILKCAEIHFQQKEFAKSNDFYAELVSYSIKNIDKIKGYRGQMLCSEGLELPDGVKLFATKIITNASVKSKDRDEAYLKRAQAELQLKDDSTALNDFRFVMNNSKTELGAEANYRIAEYYYRNAKNKESISSLRKLNENYASYDYWLGKSFLLIADNYIATNELFQAKATIKSVIENSATQEIVYAAKQKLLFLEQNGSGADTEIPVLDTLNKIDNEK